LTDKQTDKHDMTKLIDAFRDFANTPNNNNNNNNNNNETKILLKRKPRRF